MMLNTDDHEKHIPTRGSFTDHFFKSIGQNDLGDILSTSYFCSFTLGGL